jgi:cytochrome bd-type quinol oxidase subunit 1
VSSEVTVDRLQFTLTVTYHYLFPILTMGLALFSEIQIRERASR